MMLRPRHFWEFIVAMWSDWSGRVSGVLSFFLSLGAIYYQWIINHPKAWLWGLAGFSYLVASFSVWYKNHPDLLIEVIQVISFEDDKIVFTGSVDTAPYFFNILLHLVNTRPENNTIKFYRLSIKLSGGEIKGDLIRAINPISAAGPNIIDLNEVKYTALKQGIPVEGWLRFAIHNPPLNIHTPPLKMEGGKYTVIIADAYRRSYKLKGSLPSRSPQSNRHAPQFIITKGSSLPQG